MMNSAEIRNSFLEFFRSKGHEVVKSSSLIPRHDPTLLFTNAGMVQFKSVFLGEEKRPYTRAVTCQKCMRAGGKHSDLENVGHTARHHTFFEMLGNFSFGDYFKKEAIRFAWELLTEWYKLPKDRLWVSVYREDDEAEKLWTEVTDISSDKIVRLGAKDNFWQMGDTGPCGPCSEIIIDQGDDVGCGKPDCRVGCDCDRYLELWNLVFMQFNRDELGNLTPLPKPSIDTGMGLERITAVLQGKRNNFDTDLFTPIISAVESISGISYGKNAETDISIRVIADHIRAIAFLLSDGLIPSNDGRGYVLRRIIRRASRHAKLLGLEGAVLYRLIAPVTDSMGKVYPELIQENDRASKVLMIEEERFSKTLEQGMRILDNLIDGLRKQGKNTIPGDELFKLYDTYGFPLDLARDIAMDKHLLIDEDGFNREMEIQKERARASWVGEESAIAAIYKELQSEIGETVFVGYDALESESIIKAILKDGHVITEASEGDEVELFLDKTPFYGESGGQVGDAGVIYKISSFKFQISNCEAEAEVLDTKKELGLHSHIVKIKKGGFNVWDKVHCIVDRDKRIATARNHTATHLLHTALRSVLGEHVKQAGSLVSPDRMRFDFTHFYALDTKEIDEIEDIVNEKILDNIRVETEVMDIKDALKSGVTALFGEKYGERVRVVRVPSFSAELCGGTHCRQTGDIGLFVIVSEGSVASGIRRIEALTGKAAFDYLKHRSREFQKIAEMLKTDNPPERVERLLNEIKDMGREIESLKSKAAAQSSSSIIQKAKEIDGTKILACRVDNLEQKDLRVLADNVRDRLGSGIIVLASAKDGHASMVAMVTPDLTKKYNAGEILKQVAAIAGGRGGGKADMAQGGTKELGKLDKAIEAVYDLVKTKWAVGSKK
ncbi:alanine--tRNA ligase [Dissulfurispira thermophila]|uniref:Alanine--tRNA ligase n=2 Tax=Dissulfurispira thermophila TaxID=2715679 RepID=A0A7G1H2W9_9BACT|nr:alanine--tRNA ligase [Dissulfurispira thermophila]BCB96529.1 alanine--tRNA ligase [Dissulfurispira thermophila]